MQITPPGHQIGINIHVPHLPGLVKERKIKAVTNSLARISVFMRQKNPRGVDFGKNGFAENF
jgi:hypothetical protein